MQLPEGGDFAMHSSEGPQRLSDFRGRAVIMYFGDGACQEFCPPALKTLAEALNQLTSSERKGLTALFVSIDPGHDTVIELNRQAQHYHPNLRGAVIDADALAAAAQRYGLSRQGHANAGVDHRIEHASLFYSLDRQGNLQSLLPHGIDADDLAQSLRQSLARNPE